MKAALLVGLVLALCAAAAGFGWLSLLFPVGLAAWEAVRRE